MAYQHSQTHSFYIYLTYRPALLEISWEICFTCLWKALLCGTSSYLSTLEYILIYIYILVYACTCVCWHVYFLFCLHAVNDIYWWLPVWPCDISMVVVYYCTSPWHLFTLYKTFELLFDHLCRQVSFYDDLSVIQFTEEALESEGYFSLFLNFCYLLLISLQRHRQS